MMPNNHPLYKLYQLMKEQDVKNVNREQEIFMEFDKVARTNVEGRHAWMMVAVMKMLTERKEIDIILTEEDIKEYLSKFSVTIEADKETSDLLLTMVPRDL